MKSKKYTFLCEKGNEADKNTSKIYSYYYHFLFTHIVHFLGLSSLSS